MSTRSLQLLAASLLLVFPSAGRAQALAGPARVRTAAEVPMPVRLDTTGMFQAAFARVGDDLFIGGQPTAAALRALRQQGVTTVVNLRTPREMANRRAVPFDEAALVAELGMRYVYLPVRGDEEHPYAPATVAAFGKALAEADGKVLLHCTIAWRASHLWAAYLASAVGMPLDRALSHGEAINLMARHGGDGRQPVEQFLGRDIPALH